MDNDIDKVLFPEKNENVTEKKEENVEKDSTITKEDADSGIIQNENPEPEVDISKVLNSIKDVDLTAEQIKEMKEAATNRKNAAKDSKKVDGKEQEAAENVEKTENADKEGDKFKDEVVRIKLENTDLKLKGLVEKGCITPAVANSIKNNAEKFIVAGHDDALSDMIEMLSDNKSVDLSKKANPQYVLVDNADTEKSKKLLEKIDGYNKARKELRKSIQDRR